MKVYLRLLVGMGLGLFIIFSGCQEKKVIVANPETFDISNFYFPQVLNKRSGRPFLFTAKVTHPEGSAGITEVYMRLKDFQGIAHLNFEMLDDGNALNQHSGDVIAFDQIYSCQIAGNEITVPSDTYWLEIVAVSRQNETKVSPPQPLEVLSNVPPEILAFSFPDSIRAGMPPTPISVTVNDSDGINDVRWVLLQGFTAGYATPSFQDTLFNPGNNSSIFQQIIDSSYAVRRKGNFEMQFLAEDRSGERSSPQLQNVYFENTPPQLWDSQVPDTLFLPPSGSNPIDTLISIRVKDRQSLRDIDVVYYFSLKPDGTLANNGNPFFMWDNGLPFLGDPNQLQYAGDKLAGDGIFSFTVLLPPGVLTGKYLFSFYALDRVNQESMVWVDSVWVRN